MKKLLLLAMLTTAATVQASVWVGLTNQTENTISVTFYRDDTLDHPYTMQSFGGGAYFFELCYLPEDVYVVTKDENENVINSVWWSGLSPNTLMEWYNDGWYKYDNNVFEVIERTQQNYWAAVLAGMGIGFLWFGFGWQYRLAKKIGNPGGGEYS